MEPLAWIGRQRSCAVAALVLIGILLPPVGAALKPYVTEAVIGLLCIAFLRIDVEAFRHYLRRPGIVIAGVVWTSFLIPPIFALVGWIFALEAIVPALFLGLMLQAVASPMMAAPAFAALMGLDATLVLATLIVSTALVPLSAPFFVSLAGLDLTLSPLSLGLKLFLILAGSALAGLLLRRIVGAARVAHYRDEIDGINIIFLFVFVAAVMGDVGVRFLAQPLPMLGLTLLAFTVFGLLLALTNAVFRAAGPPRAFALGMVSSQRNMGLMLAATGGALPDTTWMYFAVSQFPIYLSPFMLQPLARLVTREAN